MKKIRVAVVNHSGNPLPEYASVGASGMDLRAFLTESFCLLPGKRHLFPTGISVEIPDGYEGQVRPRSGLALQQGVTVLNSPGTIDADYRGEVKVLLINLGENTVLIDNGMRIAQLVFAPVVKTYLQEVLTLSNSTRNVGGFGHTGLK